jgi:hypothetical protein
MNKFEKVVAGLLMVIAVELGVLVGVVLLSEVVVEVEQVNE